MDRNEQIRLANMFRPDSVFDSFVGLPVEPGHGATWRDPNSREQVGFATASVKCEWASAAKGVRRLADVVLDEARSVGAIRLVTLTPCMVLPLERLDDEEHDQVCVFWDGLFVLKDGSLHKPRVAPEKGWVGDVSPTTLVLEDESVSSLACKYSEARRLCGDPNMHTTIPEDSTPGHEFVVVMSNRKDGLMYPLLDIGSGDTEEAALDAAIANH